MISKDFSALTTVGSISWMATIVRKYARMPRDAVNRSDPHSEIVIVAEKKVHEITSFHFMSFEAKSIIYLNICPPIDAEKSLWLLSTNGQRKTKAKEATPT